MVILVGDVGGTKTRLALYDREDAANRQTFERRVVADFDSRSAPSLEEIVRGFLAGNDTAGRVEAACLGIPDLWWAVRCAQPTCRGSSTRKPS